MKTLAQPTRRALIAIAAGAAIAAGIAQAQTPATAPTSTQTAAQTAVQTAATPPAAPQLTIRDIYDRMEAAGYRDMREIEFSKGSYEVKARNAQGERVKLYVNASTGAVERTRSGD